jgi:abortive infection bacteriophage resistance protein
MYKKNFLTYDEQIEFLISEKNLAISDQEYAKKILFQTGYFPLITGYKELFKNPETKQFINGTRFEDIYELYRFDKALRSIFIEYILIVERNIKSSLSYHFCNVFGDSQTDYLNTANYDYNGKKIPMIQNMLKIIFGQIRQDSDYMYIRHYIERYGEVPLWVLFNVLTLGQMSKIYACQKGRIKILVCQDFGNLKINDMEKMLAVMTKFRNVCAHNDRLFDFRTKDAILDMDIHKQLKIEKNLDRYLYGKNDLFAQVIILKLLLTEDEFSNFYHDICRCFRNNPIYVRVLNKMGFPEDWKRIARIKKFKINAK